MFSAFSEKSNTMSRHFCFSRLFSVVAALAAITSVAGCHAEEPTPVKPRPASLKLGEPLVDHLERLKPLNPESTVWIDMVGKRVVLQGQVCQRDALLEMFACLANTKEHESIVAVPCKAFVVHTALLAVGAKAGKSVRFDPEYVPASGTEIDIAVHWKNDKGEVQTARARDWVRDVKTGKAMEHPWVFAGSGFWDNEVTGQRVYEAESGDFICVSNFPSAMLDLPIKSSKDNAELMFRAFTERIPPLGTSVTLVLTPKARLAPASTPGKTPAREKGVGTTFLLQWIGFFAVCRGGGL